jgi:hypothetical protein
MRVQRVAGVVCKLITEGEWGYVGLGHVGSRGVLWLGERGGGECERGPGGGFLEQELRGRRQHLI